MRRRGWEALYLLRGRDPAGERLLREGVPYLELGLRGMPRGSLRAWPGFLLGVARSIRLARNVMEDWRPQRVVGMGAYVTFPAILAAWRSGIPSMIHESNSVLGLANRLCLPLVSKAALGLPIEPRPGRGRLPCVLTGTPIRPELWRLPDARKSRQALGLDPDRPTVLAFGGSQGAAGLNRLVPRALRLAGGGMPAPPQCLHLSGPAMEAEVRAAYSGSGPRAEVRPYLPRMELAYAAADLVICRAGAGTLAELAAARKPALLVPFPFSAAGHQDANARVFEAAGAARRLPEAGLTPEALADAVRDLISSGPLLAAMSEAYATLGLPAPESALSALADAVETLAW